MSVPYALHDKTVENELWSTTNDNDISYTNGNVGIGTSTPSNKLTLEGMTVSTEGRTFLEARNNSVDNASSVNLKLFAGTGSSFTELYHHSDTYSSSANFMK